MRFLLFSVIAALGPASLLAQAYPGSQGCPEPFPVKIADFTYTTEADLNRRLLGLRIELKRFTEESQAVVQVYGASISRISDIEIDIERVKKNLSDLAADSVWIRDAGYRNERSFEFFIRPLKCTQSPEAISDLRVDEVQFSDYPSRRIEPSDLYSRKVSSPEAKCSPAARAVRACDEGSEAEVFLIVDEKGKVVFARGISGHPLNRIHGERLVKTMKFRPYKVGGIPVSVSGTIRVVYSKPEEIVTN